MKARYVIYFSGIFEQGHVRTTLFGRSRTVILESEKEKRLFATRFRWRWVADMYCGMLNRVSRQNYDFRTYTVNRDTNDW